MSWFDDLTTRLGDTLIAPQMPHGAQGSMPPLDPAQRSAVIANGLVNLGGTLSAAGRNRIGPVEALGAGFQNLQAQGRQNATNQLQMGLCRAGSARRSAPTRRATC